MNVPTHLSSLRTIYMEHLSSPLSGRLKGTVAGKGTRRGMRRAADWAETSAASWQELLNTWHTTPERIWIWSDHHLGHENIIRYTNRPFGNASQMNQSLLEAASCVPDDDWLLFVGDLAMWIDPPQVKEWVGLCPGRKAIVIGNHDCRGRGHPDTMEEWAELGFEAASDCMVLPKPGGDLWLTHYPLPLPKVTKGVVNVHGHTHTDILQGPYLNVCVENLGFASHRLIDLLPKGP